MTNRRARKKLNKLYVKIRQERKLDEKGCYKFIKEFMELYGKCKPDQKNCREEKVINACALSIRKALERKDYSEVLHEILKMCYFGIIHRLNVKTALTDLLDKYVDEDLEAVDN